MPETSVKGRRRAERRRPETKRDEIVRALSERMPDMDLSKFDWSRFDPSKIERPRIDLPEIDLHRVDLPKVDVRRAMEEAAIRAGVKERTRSRWPLIAGLLIAGTVGLWALLRRPAVRAQVEETARKARERIEQMRLEREGASPSMDDIEDAVGVIAASHNGSDPVAVGPGTKTRKRTRDAAEVADERVAAVEETVAAVEETAAPA